MQNSNNPNSKIWDSHYKKQKSTLSYPDENLVRILSKISHSGLALDHGTGSGRHLKLLQEFGYDCKACDYSEESILKVKSIFPNVEVRKIDSLLLPYDSNSFDLVVSWGVLHYNSTEEIKQIVSEWKRILKANSYLIGTVRADTDTHLKLNHGISQNLDLKSSKIQLFNLEKVKTILQDFQSLEIAYMERTPLGKLEERICHWIFLAKN